MERLAEDRKGPSCMEYKKRQMVAALDTNVKVPDPSHYFFYVLLQSCGCGPWKMEACKTLVEQACHPAMYLYSVHEVMEA